jgi:hypothetical protein
MYLSCLSRVHSLGRTRQLSVKLGHRRCTGFRLRSPRPSFYAVKLTTDRLGPRIEGAVLTPCRRSFCPSIVKCSFASRSLLRARCKDKTGTIIYVYAKADVNQLTTAMLIQSISNFSRCNVAKTETMRTDGGQFFYECTGCGIMLKASERTKAKLSRVTTAAPQTLGQHVAIDVDTSINRSSCSEARGLPRTI